MSLKLNFGLRANSQESFKLLPIHQSISYRAYPVLTVLFGSLKVRVQREIRSAVFRIEITAPQISSEWVNCSPTIPSSYRRLEIKKRKRAVFDHTVLIQCLSSSPPLFPLSCEKVHLPPSLFCSSSHMGLTPNLNM